MKVCFWGTYRRNYSRNVIIRNGLLENGVRIKECHKPFLEDTKERNETIFKAGNLAKAFFELAVKYYRLVMSSSYYRDADFIFVGFIGHYDMFVAKLLSKIMRKKLVFDTFISLYDSIVDDKKLIKKETLLADMIRWLDRTACHLADIVIYESREHKKYFEEELKVLTPKSHVLYVGADDAIFYPRKNIKGDNIFRVLYYGHFVPLQGIDYIIEAADMLKNNNDIKFKLIGRGQDMLRIKTMIERKKLKNIEFIDTLMPREKLTEEIAFSDVCLGIFGKSDKAGRVIPNKVYECLAMRKAVITGDTPSVRELFQNRKDLLLCERANAQAIADSIIKLKNDRTLRIKISEGGYKSFKSKCSTKILCKGLKDALLRMA